jgi:hypothetical protein
MRLTGLPLSICRHSKNRSATHLAAQQTRKSGLHFPVARYCLCLPGRHFDAYWGRNIGITKVCVFPAVNMGGI